MWRFDGIKRGTDVMMADMIADTERREGQCQGKGKSASKQASNHHAPSVLACDFFLSAGDDVPILEADDDEPVDDGTGFCCCDRVATAADMMASRWYGMGNRVVVEWRLSVRE